MWLRIIGPISLSFNTIYFPSSYDIRFVASSESNIYTRNTLFTRRTVFFDLQTFFLKLFFQAFFFSKHFLPTCIWYDDAKKFILNSSKSSCLHPHWKCVRFQFCNSKSSLNLVQRNVNLWNIKENIVLSFVSNSFARNQLNYLVMLCVDSKHFHFLVKFTTVKKHSLET